MNDEPTLSIHLTQAHAEALLASFGYARNDRKQWISPSGVGYWCTDEALTMAMRHEAEGVTA